MLRLVWFQLHLFDLGPRPARWQPMDDAERDRRSGREWLRSIRTYLEFRSGSSWRSLTNPAHRWDPERLWYLDGLREVSSLIAGRTQALPLRILENKTDDLRAFKLAGESRAWLVEELMRTDLMLTDRKLLSRLARLKLARMLIAARDRHVELGKIA